MSTGGRARLMGAALLIVAILVFAASLLLIERRLQRLTRNATDGATESSWSVFQARFELERLLHGLDRAVATPGDSAALRTRFDLFWSRL